MRIYPDTSFLVALRYFRDKHHEAATRYFETNQEEIFLWSPWHRVEVANTIRQFLVGDSPRISQGEARSIIHSLEQEVRFGYFLHMEADWRDVLRTANELSIEQGDSIKCRSADLLHIAYAKEIAAELFISFDQDQVDFAKAVGLDALIPS